MSTAAASRDRGDHPTPPALVARVLACLTRRRVDWSRVIEPAAGEGRFVTGLLAQRHPPDEIHAIEACAAHAAAIRRGSVASGADARAKRTGASARGPLLHVRTASVFSLDLGRDLRWRTVGPILVVGNPPWVTTSALGALGSRNRPPRARRAGVAGLEALTGASNYDLTEAIALKALSQLADQAPVVAFLCKLSTARRLLGEVARRTLPVGEVSVFHIDARRWFGVGVAACLLLLRGHPGASCRYASVFADLEATEPASFWRTDGSAVIRCNARPERSACGRGHTQGDWRPAVASPLAWRQGLKHDATDVMELSAGAGGTLVNGLGEKVDVEIGHRFPLLKASDLFHGRSPGRREVIVPQETLGADTLRLRRSAPRLWRYLAAHAERLERRRSAVYRRRPPFSIFGIGPYAFAPFKVAVSGLHGEVRFRAVPPGPDGRPVMVDDTCYLVGMDSASQAALTVALLESDVCLQAMSSLLFEDAKRPVTKRLLVRLDVVEAWRRGDRRAIEARAEAELARLAPGERPRWETALDTLLRRRPGGRH